MEKLLEYLDALLPELLDFLIDILWVVVILLVGMKIIGSVIKLLKKVMERSNVEPGVSSFLSSVVKYAMYAILVMIVLSQFGVTASSVVAVLGSAGLTIGLALQGSLSNLAGGVLILILN